MGRKQYRMHENAYWRLLIIQNKGKLLRSLLVVVFLGKARFLCFYLKRGTLEQGKGIDAENTLGFRGKTSQPGSDLFSLSLIKV